jgi:hypothetical protein
MQGPGTGPGPGLRNPSPAFSTRHTAAVDGNLAHAQKIRLTNLIATVRKYQGDNHQKKSKKYQPEAKTENLYSIEVVLKKHHLFPEGTPTANEKSTIYIRLRKK